MSKPRVMVPVAIGIDQVLSDSASGGYAGRIIDITPGRPPADRLNRDLIIPIGQNQFKTVKLRPGAYIVEAVSPSGELIDQYVGVNRRGRREKQVRLGSGALLEDALGWQVASGNIDRAVLAAENGVREAQRAMLGVRRAWRLFPFVMIVGATLAIALVIVIALAMFAPGSAEISGSQMLADWAFAPGLWLFAAAGLVACAAVAVGRMRRRWRGAARIITVEVAEADEVADTAAVEEAPVGIAVAAEAPPPVAAAAHPAVEAILFRLRDGNAAWRLVKAAAAGEAAVGRIIADAVGRAPIGSNESQGFRFFEIAADHPLVRADANGGLFVLVPAAGSAGEIVSVPLPWDCADGHRAQFEIAASTNPESLFRAASTVKDVHMATILGYMSAGRLTQAELLVRDAKHLLDHKYSNAWAAAVGAYVLLATCTDRKRGKRWRPWIENLCRDFPSLADGAILQGWNLLQRQDGTDYLDRARRCFVGAVDRGVPIYAEGVRVLQSGLATFGRFKEEDARLAEAIVMVDELATRCSPTQAFTTLKISSVS